MYYCHLLFLVFPLFHCPFRQLLQLLYIDDLLEIVKRRFVDLFSEEARALECSKFPLAFDGHFDRCFKQASAQANKRREQAASSASPGGGAAARDRSAAEMEGEEEIDGEEKTLRVT